MKTFSQFLTERQEKPQGDPFGRTRQSLFPNPVVNTPAMQYAYHLEPGAERKDIDDGILDEIAAKTMEKWEEKSKDPWYSQNYDDPKERFEDQVRGSITDGMWQHQSKLHDMIKPMSIWNPDGQQPYPEPNKKGYRPEPWSSRENAMWKPLILNVVEKVLAKNNITHQIVKEAWRRTIEELNWRQDNH